MIKHAFLFALCLPLLARAQWNNTAVVSNLPYPICVTEAPDGRFFISLKGGSGVSAPQNAKVNVYNANGSFQATLWDFTDSVETYFERGVLGVELDPNFSTNHWVYVFYNHDPPAKIRVVRFTEVNGTGTNPLVVFEVTDPFSAGNHTGGNLHFAPGDTTHLFISIGDRATSSNAPNLTKWAGKMLRINKDGSIPADNPFYDDGNPATGNDDRIWAYGLRNTFDFTFSLLNDSLYGSENGLNTYDEINQIHRGANYGWPSCEGISGGGCSNPAFTAPLTVWGAPLPAITGIVHYSDTLIPGMQGHLLITDYNNGNVHEVVLGNAPFYDTVLSKSTVSGLSFNSAIDIIQGMNGCLYVIDGGYTPSGSLRKICPQLPGYPEYSIRQLNLYPNPTQGWVYTDQANGNGTYVVYNAMGAEVMAGALAPQLDLSSLPPGVYILSARAGNEHYRNRLVKY